MRLERLENKLLVWETGSKNNRLLYDGECNLDQYSRRSLSFIEKFLLKESEVNEAKKIENHLGKIIRIKTIPKLIPTSNYVVDTSLDMLNETIQRFIDRDGLQLDPDFQRAHVWNMNQRIAFVEFVLQGGKVPPIQFNHEGWMGSYKGEMVIVDGKQRLTSLLMFLNNEFAVFKELDSENVGYYYNEFDHIGITIKYGVNDLPTKKQVLEWYLQMNKGNVAHTEEELNKVEGLLKLENNK